MTGTTSLFRHPLSNGRSSLRLRVSPGPRSSGVLNFDPNSKIEDAVSSFFKPTSQKPPEPITWSERSVNEDTPTSLIVGKYVPPGTPAASSDAPPAAPKKKIAAFDLVCPLSSVAEKPLLTSLGLDPRQVGVWQEIRL